MGVTGGGKDVYKYIRCVMQRGSHLVLKAKLGWLERLTMKRLLIVRRCEPIVRFSCCSVRYGECRRNHAASTGGYAVDGCREFIAEGEEGTGGALKCAACGCHRSFHRRVRIYEFAWDYGSETSSTE